MTSPEMGIAERIRDEIVDLDRSAARATAVWQRAQVSADQDYYLDAVALNLHGFYSGIERLFELTARHIDQAVPSGESWHQDLINQMAQEVPDVRPAMISASVAAGLDEYRRFRHLVRNVYAIDLVPDKMQGLLERLPLLWNRLRVELVAFAAFLEQIAPESS